MGNSRGYRQIIPTQAAWAYVNDIKYNYYNIFLTKNGKILYVRLFYCNYIVLFYLYPLRSTFFNPPKYIKSTFHNSPKANQRLYFSWNEMERKGKAMDNHKQNSTIMNYQEINVPVQYRYLSQWQDLLNMLPQQGKYILNKVNTGCGGTTLLLQSPYPTILVSPRSNVLYSKSAQFPNAHLFRKKTDTSTCVPVLKERLRDYINMCNGSFHCPMMQPIIPKILVTIDSYPYVAEQLAFMGILDRFTVLVDEFQCIMSDSKFKGRVELEFLHNLRGVNSVCYMSATPIVEDYLNHFPDFADVAGYYKLVWHPSVLETPNLDMRPYKPKQSSKGICREIIQGYRQNGYFAQKIVNGCLVNSTEVVIFLNEVRSIVSIIEENKLQPDEVNVLCSPSNKYVKDLKRLGVHIGELTTDPYNPINRTFTFVTRASFEGVDFYSTNAFTYIFCDGVLDWNKNDLIIDVPQILGRQRLDQPFRKDAILYYRAKSKTDSEAIIDKVKKKEEATQAWIDKFNASDQQTKMMLKDGIMKRSEKTRYADDYVEFVDDMNGGFVLKENYLVKSTELRDWQLSNHVYNNPMNIIKAVVGQTGINVTSNHGYTTMTGVAAWDNFNHDFFKATTFPDRMRIYADMREQHPEHKDDLYLSPFIDYRYHQAYDLLGGDKLRALRYREKDIAEAVSSVMLHQVVCEECWKIFLPGCRYKQSEVKVALQRTYNSCGINKTAKANDLPKFMPNAQLRQLTTQGTGKRELYYEIM